MTNQNIKPRSPIPIISAGLALKSLRDSGHSLSTALGEVIDNSIEAKANHIRIELEEAVNSKGKKHVHRIAVVDDGVGMDAETIQHSLKLGYSTRYMHTDTIGKYGVGAKLAAINFGRRIDAWSRNQADEPWLHVYLDLDEVLAEENSGNDAHINPPSTTPIPGEYNNILPTSTGTLVVWSCVDRLEDGRIANNFDNLRLELEKELSRIFRNFIDGGIKLFINGKELVAFDPLILMNDDWSDRVLNEKFSIEAKKKGEEWKNRTFTSNIIAEEKIKVGSSTAQLRITLYPEEARRKRGKGGDKLATSLRIPENEGTISFVRLGREVSYTIVPKILPKGIQNPDRFIGIEVSFSPDLDDYFGIRNVKRGVEPHGQLRNRIRELLSRYIDPTRKIIQDYWGPASKKNRDNQGEHSEIITATAQTDATMPKPIAQDNRTEDETRKVFEELAKDVGYDKEEDKKQYIKSLEKLPFILESVDFPGKEFITLQHIGGKVIIRLNTRHSFYRELWEPIKAIAEQDPAAVSGQEAVQTARRTVEALTLLVVAYGKAESMHQTPDKQYDDLRSYWGQFLSTLLNNVKDVF